MSVSKFLRRAAHTGRNQSTRFARCDGRLQEVANGRRRPRRLLVLFIAMLPSSLATGAGSAPASYEPEERFVLQMADERFGECTAEPKAGYRFTFRCASGQPRIEDLGPYMHLPIRVGKSWKHHYREVIGGTRMTLEVKVTGRETVTVPAGTYESYRLEMEESGSGTAGKVEQTCWYAPAVQFPVKCAGAIGSSFELLEHRR